MNFDALKQIAISLYKNIITTISDEIHVMIFINKKHMMD